MKGHVLCIGSGSGLFGSSGFGSGSSRPDPRKCKLYSVQVNKYLLRRVFLAYILVRGVYRFYFMEGCIELPFYLRVLYSDCI